MATNTNTVARAVHELSLATWFGGTLMGAVGLNAASAEVDDPAQRARVANSGWARWTPVNLAAIAGYVASGYVLTKENKSRLFAQRGAGRTAMIKGVLTGITLGATAYSRVLGERVIREGDVDVESGVQPSEKTPEEVARAQRRLRLLQWAIPAHVGALIVLGARMGEQQRPLAVVKGIAERAAEGAKKIRRAA